MTGGLLLLCIVVVTFFLPIWSIGEIQVTGQEIYTEEDIIKASGIEPKSHILTVSSKRVVEKIKSLTYVTEVELDYRFPNQLDIIITEEKPIGYVRLLGNYLCLGEQGQVLEQVTQPYLKLPIIEGLKFTKFTLGQPLEIENEDNFLTAIEIFNVLRKYNYQQKVEIIDVSNIEQIHLYVDKLDVIIGNIRDFDKKVRWLTEIHKEYPMGVLDLSIIEGGQVILTPLT